MARSYGRDATGTWVEIDNPDYINLATLVQVLRLQQGESPFYGNYGIPAEASIMSQIAPDAAITRTQAQFSPYFASLTIQRIAGAAVPTYNIAAVFPNGTVIQSTLAS